jgi:hypothetical protein
MHDDALLSRITADPKIFGGKPIVRGMRIRSSWSSAFWRRARRSRRF